MGSDVDPELLEMLSPSFILPLLVLKLRAGEVYIWFWALDQSETDNEV